MLQLSVFMFGTHVAAGAPGSMMVEFGDVVVVVGSTLTLGVADRVNVVQLEGAVVSSSSPASQE